MVRLKVTIFARCNQTPLNFNSTMVRLKVKDMENIQGFQAAFQFHYGSVKSILKSLNAPLLRKFQFHYGSVKSRLQVAFAYDEVKFQFHYGSVKSFLMNLNKRKDNNFNSTMVRLKESSGMR